MALQKALLTTWVISLSSLAACGGVQTPKYAIHVAADEVDTAQVDAAMDAALELTGLAPDRLRDRYVYLQLAPLPITGPDGSLFYGYIEQGDLITSGKVPCLFAHDSALIHEFVHYLLGLQGDADNSHRGNVWQHEPQIRAQLAALRCPP